MDEALYTKILKQREVPDDIKWSRLFVNVIGKHPAVHIGATTENFTDGDITSQATTLRILQISLQMQKMSSFFSYKDRLHNVYGMAGYSFAGSMVDADLVWQAKQKVFDDSEDVISRPELY